MNLKVHGRALVDPSGSHPARPLQRNACGAEHGRPVGRRLPKRTPTTLLATALVISSVGLAIADSIRPVRWFAEHVWAASVIGNLTVLLLTYFIVERLIERREERSRSELVLRALGSFVNDTCMALAVMTGAAATEMHHRVEDMRCDESGRTEPHPFFKEYLQKEHRKVRQARADVLLVIPLDSKWLEVSESVKRVTDWLDHAVDSLIFRAERPAMWLDDPVRFLPIDTKEVYEALLWTSSRWPNDRSFV
jgi:hypothetical protein